MTAEMALNFDLFNFIFLAYSQDLFSNHILVSIDLYQDLAYSLT